MWKSYSVRKMGAMTGEGNNVCGGAVNNAAVLATQ